MSIFHTYSSNSSNINDNKLEKEDDWGWFICLDLDATTPNKKTKCTFKKLQTIHENVELHVKSINYMDDSPDESDDNMIKNMCSKLNYNYTYHKILLYEIFYKYIGLFLCFSYYKQKKDPI